MHFDMPAEKVAKVVAAAKARVHGNDSCRSFDANESKFARVWYEITYKLNWLDIQQRGRFLVRRFRTGPLSEGSGFMSTPVSRHSSSVLGEESSETLKQRYVRQKFTSKFIFISEIFYCL